MHLKVTPRSSLRAFILAIFYCIGLLGLPAVTAMAAKPGAKTAPAEQPAHWQQEYLKTHPNAPFINALTLMGTGSAPGPLWTFANVQSPQLNALLCLGCFVETAPAAVDGDTTTSSRLVLPIGLASTLGQRLTFPGDYLAGDYVAIDMEVPNQALSASLLGGINVTTYNNSVSNNDQTFLNAAAAHLQLLGLGTGNTNKFRVVLQVQHNFNAVQVNISAALSAFGSLRIYEAAAIVPVIANPDTTVIISGQSAALSASLRLPNATFRWYTQPTGGSPVMTGANVNTPPLTDATTYYIEATTPDNLSSYVRTPVTVRVSGAPGPIWTYGDDQESPRTGGLACALCSISNPGLAVDGDTTTASGFSLPVGILGSVGQLVKFPGIYYPGDSIVLFMETPENLLTGQLLPGITVETYHNAILGPAIENNDEIRLDAGAVRLELLGLNVGNNRKFKVTIPVTDTFDAVQVNLSPAVSLALAEPLKLYEAVAMAPVTVTPSPATVNYNQQATLTPSIRIPNATFNWYTSPTGGAPFATGVLTTPPLTRNATYYVEAVDPTGKTSFQRTGVTVRVAGGTGPLWVYGIEQESPRLGGVACVLCSVSNPALAVDGDTATFSHLTMPVGLASTVGQYIRFPAAYQAGDSVVLYLGTTADPLVNAALLSGIRVQTFLGNTPNNDAITLDNSLIKLQLLGSADGINHFRVSFPANHAFDGTQVDLISLVGLSDGLYVGEAAAMMPVEVTRVTPPSDTVDAGQTARFTASIPRLTNAVFSWYETPTGGSPIFVGADFTTPPLIGDKTYYVEAFTSSDGKHSLIRTAVPVYVRPLNTLTCGAATTQSSGTSGVACLGCGVLNGPNAVDSDVNTASEMRVGIGLLGGVFQGIGFPAISGAADTLRIGVGTTTRLLDAGLLAGLSFTLYNGNTQVQQYNNTALLDLRLLADSTHSELVFGPGVAFDSVHISFNALLAAVTAIDIFYAKVTPPNAGVQDSVVRACLGGGVTLTANSPAGATFRWFSQYAGGTALHTGASFSPGNITSDTVFFVEAVSTGVNGCGSNTRTPVYVKLGLPGVTVNPTSITIDRGQTATFNVVGPNPSYIYRWFRVNSGGTAIDTGAQFITPALDTNAVFYVQADSSTCSSKRTPVFVTISGRPLPPVIVPDTAFVSPGQSATFRIANPDPALTYRWYNVDSGGTVLATDTMYITPAVIANGRVYAEAVDASGQASRRASAVVQLVPGPGGPLPCTYANAQESPVYIGLLNLCLLCGVTQPGQAIDGDVNTAARVHSNVGIGSIGQMLHFQQPGVAGDSLRLVLGLPTGIADAQLLGGIRIQTYNNGSPVGNPVFLNTSLLHLELLNGSKFTATLPVNSTYDAVLVTLGGVLTALTTMDIYNAEQIILPAKPEIGYDSLTVCLGSSARIVARDTAGVVVKWYATTNATTPLFTGGIFNTPVLNQASTTYYIETGRNGCANPQRVLVTVKAVARPAAPTLTATSVNICVGNTATLSVSNPQVGYSYKWYDAATAGNLVDSGAVLNIVPPSTGVDTVTYYVEAGAGTCSSSTRTAGNIYVATRCGAGPGADTTALTLCAGASTTLQVDSVEAGATYRWYNMADNSLVATATSYTTPALTANARYRLTATFPGNILDTLRIYDITVASSLAVPTLVAGEIITTSGSTATFAVLNPQGGVMYRWFTVPTGGTAVDTGTSFTTPPLAGDSAKYYVEAIAGACSSPARAVATVRLSAGGGVPCYAANTTQSPVYTAPISICLLCGVDNATNAVDGDTTTSSKVRSNIGIGYIGQILNFQNPGKAGDSIRLILSLPGGLADAQLLGGVRVQTYNNGTPAGNPVFLNGGLGLLRLSLISGNKFVATIAAPADYNAVYVSVGGVLTALTTMEIFAAEQYVLPAKPSADTDSLTVCIGASARLVARDTAGMIVKWYAAARGGAALHTGGVFNTPAIAQPSTTYYIETSRNGCANPIRIPVTVTGDNCGTGPGADTTNLTLCAGGSTTLRVDSIQAGVTYRWYNMANDSLVATAVSYTTPVLNADAHYRVVGTYPGNVLDTIRIFNITVANSLAVPTLVANVITTTNGSTATFIVQNPLGGVLYRWFTTPAGGTAIDTGTTFTTPPLTGDSAKYYVEAITGACSSPSRAVATVRLSAGGNVPCYAANTTQGPVYTAPISICLLCGITDATSAVDGDVNTSSKVRANIGIGYIGQILNFQNPGKAGDSIRLILSLPGGLADAQLLGGVRVQTYNNGNPAGNPIFLNGGLGLLRLSLLSGNKFVATIAAPADYNAVYVSIGGVLTALTTMEVFAAEQYVLPAKPSADTDSLTVCLGSTARLVARDTAGVLVRWYATATGGTALHTGGVFVTPAITQATTTYYIETSRNGCANPVRIPVTVSAIDCGGGTGDTTALTICRNTSTTLQADPNDLGNGAVAQWYNTANNALVFTGPSFNTPALSTNTNYRLEAHFPGGFKDTLQVYTITVVDQPGAPDLVLNDQQVPRGTAATFTIASPQAGFSYIWYSAATGGTALDTGITFTTPPLNADSAVYYVGATAGSCSSTARARVVVRAIGGGSGDSVAVSICRGTSAQLNVPNPVNGATYRWYNTANNSLVFTGNPFNTPALNANTNYRLVATLPGGAVDTIQVYNITVTDPPTVPVLASSSVISCNSGPVQLAVLNPIPGVTYAWYTAAVGGTQVGTGATLNVTPPPGVDSITYYAGAMVGTCTSSSRAAATVRVINNLQPPALTLTEQSTSLGGTVTFTVSNPQAGITYKWYDVPAGGTPLAIGTSFTTPPLTGDSAKYYVEASAGSCTSATRAVVIVRNNNNGGNDGDTSVITLCIGNSITLNVVNPQNGSTYRWYNAANNSLVYTGTIFSTPALNADITYVIEATLPGGAKEINHVYQLTVANNTTPPAVVASVVKICSGQDATLIVQNPLPGYTYQWYDAATGGSLVFTGPVYVVSGVTSSRDFYVQSVLNNKCASATRTRVTIEAGNTPSAPTLVSNNVITCIGTAATFTILNPDPAVSYRWYNQPNGGTLLAIGTSYTTAGLTSTTTYYVEAAFNAGCVSTVRTGVTATVVSTIDAPLANGATICSGQNAVVSIRNPTSGYIYRWYTTAIGGTPVFTGVNYTTPLLTANTVYYVESASPGGCVSASRTGVNVTVNPVPATPAVVSANIQICPGQTATLQVLNPGATLTYRWYTTATGGTAVSVGQTFNTGSLTASQQYYLEAVNTSSCASTQRTPVSVTVAAPDANDIIVDIPDPECPGIAVTITASAPTVPGANFRWFTAATGGTLLHTGASYTTPVLDNTTTYYVEVFTDGGCIGNARKAATVTVLEQLATPVVTVSDSTATSVTFSWSPITGAARYEVSINGGQTFTPPSSGANGVTHTVTGLSPNQTVTLQVRALNTNSCQTSELSAAVTGKAANPAGDQVFVPNLFSPNGDGINDVLMVYGNTIASIELHIYNGWGQEVFQSKDQRQGWNGTMNGREQPAGVYVYILKAKLQNGATVDKKGNVTIIR